MDYPWRRDRTPYKVLISEIFLTRTKATQVVPVYNNFIEKYPTLERFLDMEVNDVEDLIKSLGLLFRAKQLKELSIQIKKVFNKTIPKSEEELKDLKGIGNYGSNAILCFGFNQKKALIDTNFIRIYKRVFSIDSKTKTPKTDKYLWEFSEKLLPEIYFIEFNYALLDIGGRICLNKNPKCNICPLNQLCHYCEKIFYT